MGQKALASFQMRDLWLRDEAVHPLSYFLTPAEAVEHSTLATWWNHLELSKVLAAWSHPQVLTKLAGGAAWMSPDDSSQV